MTSRRHSPENHAELWGIEIKQFVETRSHYPEGTSALDFKDATIPRFGHSDAVLIYFFAFNHPLTQYSKRFSFLAINGPKQFHCMLKVSQIPLVRYFCWRLTGGNFWCLLLKIDKKLHRYNQIEEHRLLWSLKQMLSPGNDSWWKPGIDRRLTVHGRTQFAFLRHLQSSKTI